MIRWPGRRRISLAVSVLLLGLLSFEIYRAFYPGEAFYRGEFERVAKVDFPASGRFTFKTATFPDIHGDYQSCALFLVNTADYLSLLSQIRKQPAQGPAPRLISACRQYQMETLAGPPAYRELAQGGSWGESWEWGLLDDDRTVLFSYASW